MVGPARKRPKIWTYVVLAVLTFGVLAAWKGPDALQVGFVPGERADDLPRHWEVMPMQGEDNRTQYSMVPAGSTLVVRAVSRNSASGLVRRIEINPAEYPIIEWRWKVRNVVEEGNARTKEGDDYAARIYITFAYDPDNFGFFEEIKYRAIKALGYENVPTRALNYIWANQVPKGTILPNAYTDWVQMVVVESGSEKTGQWVLERRNIVEDYRRAFGEDPPPINGVAIMTDTDNTGGVAVAYYGDIVFRSSGEQ